MLVETPLAMSTPKATTEDFLATTESRHLTQEYVEQTVEGPLAGKYLLMTLSLERGRLINLRMVCGACPDTSIYKSGNLSQRHLFEVPI